MRILISALFLSFCLFSYGQHTFFKLYTDGGDDYANGVVELKDSTFAITGNSSSFWAGQGQAFILKIDAEGNYVWSNHYGGAESDGGEKIMYKENDGFYVAGYTNSFGNGGFDFYLFKTDLDGNLLWEKTYGGEGWERVHDAYLTRDGGVLMIGETSSNPTFDTDMWIVKTDANGDTLWTKTLGTPAGEDIARTMYPVNDSVFFVLGSQYEQDSSMVKVRGFELLENGDLGWDTSNIGVIGNTIPEDSYIREDTVYVIGHSDVSSDTASVVYHLTLQLDNQTAFGFNGPILDGFWRGKTICPTDNPTVFYCNYEYYQNSSPEYKTDVMISRYTQNFGFISSLQPVAFYDEDRIKETIPTQDGGTLSVGSSDGDINIGDKHSFALKTLPNDSTPGWSTLPEVTQLVSVEEINQLKENTSIYPNPVSEELTVAVSFSGEYDYALTDLNGRVLMQSTQNGTTTIDVSTLSSGVYFVKIGQKDIDASFKIIVR